ncbi:Lactate utilization protein C [Bremerella volcania]|uniref:Lactate utilization protein C n=1 Tax=Bremerella volcania TaxID=2527984 RepID=A0A518C2F1_9BACT|nr:LUD domain-containing protein [Bremerella volcania]QDU73392.1 Lactate utilization protein C [Bremerella volcania]
MSSKDQILKSVRNQLVPSADLPSLDQDWIQYDDAVAHFGEVLQAVGGTAIAVEGIDGLTEELAKIPAYTDAKKTVSCVEGLVGTVDLDRVEDPHELEDVDYAVLPGEFAVAENAAVWVTDAKIRHRVILFIPQHISLVIHCAGGKVEEAVVHNMAEAYQRLVWSRNEFGCFISGPSKTADIEQSLVIGAHGARSLHVFFVF